MDYPINDVSFISDGFDAAERIEAGLEAFNVFHRPDQGAGPLILIIHDRGGEIVAGLKGRTAYGWLRIDMLWVHEVCRRQGLGRKLLEAAESIAAGRGCHGAHLDTHGFQAPEFYRAHGYEVFGVLDDYPVGEQHFYLRKRLNPDMAKASEASPTSD